jgi:hypothetical protein
MKIRLAKQSDYKALASIHMECGKIQPGGVMHQLGINFLRNYYSILLKEKNSIVVVAEDDNDLIHGFCSGSLDAKEHINELKNKKISIAISLIPVILKNPKILHKILERNKFVNSSSKAINISISEGARFEYWAWRPSSKNALMAFSIMKIWLNIVLKLGVKSIKAEVDEVNYNILKLHIKLGAIVIKEQILPDGRKRSFIEYNRI